MLGVISGILTVDHVTPERNKEQYEIVLNWVRHLIGNGANAFEQGFLNAGGVGHMVNVAASPLGSTYISLG